MGLVRSDATSRWRAFLVVVAVGVYSWVAAGLRPFTLGEEVMVAIPALLVLVAACRPARRSGTEPASRSGTEPASRSGTEPVRTSRGSAALWLVLVVVAVAWELFALYSSPRSDHPTFSTIADEIMSVQFGRAVVFVLWLTLGWLLVRRPHTPAAPR